MLCENRYVLPGSPSTCIVDTALIPLPSFLLVVFGVLVLLRRSHDRSRIIIPRWIHILYMLLVVAAFGMTVVVLARNAAEHLGMGLVPMVLAGLVLVLVGLSFEITERSQSLSALFFAYWLLNIVFESIKVARMKKLVELDLAKNNYPSSDQLLDNAIILGLYVVFLFIEGLGLVLSRRQRNTNETSQVDKPETKLFSVFDAVHH